MMTVSRVTNLEQQVNDNKTCLTDFDTTHMSSLGGRGGGGGGGGVLLEDAAATRRTSGQTDVFVSMFVCSSDAGS